MSSSITSYSAKSKVVILMGAPGAGKSTIISHFGEKHRLKGREITIISPDAIKKEMFQYKAALLTGDAAKVCIDIHEESVSLAKAEYSRQLTEITKSIETRVVIFDGTGSWAPFCNELLTAAEVIRVRTSLLLVYASPDTCMNRCVEREVVEKRAIPIDRICPIFNQLMANFIHFSPRVSSWNVYYNDESAVALTSGKLVARKPSKSPDTVVALPFFFTKHLDTHHKVVEEQFAADKKGA